MLLLPMIDVISRLLGGPFQLGAWEIVQFAHPVATPQCVGAYSLL